MSSLTRLQPVNRHLLVVPHPQKEADETSVLLPEGYAPKVDKYVLATVVDVSSDCAKHFQGLAPKRSKEPTTIVIDQSMLEDIGVNGSKYCLVLENYVVGIIRGLNED